MTGLMTAPTMMRAEPSFSKSGKNFESSTGSKRYRMGQMSQSSSDRMNWFKWSMLIFFFCLLQRSNCDEMFDVQFQLQTSWPRVPLLTETVEFFSDVDNHNLLPVLRLIADELITSNFEKSSLADVPGLQNQSEVQRLLQEDGLQILERLNSTFFKSPFTGPLMSLSVSNRFFSARVEFFRTLERRLRQLKSPCQSDTWAAMCIPSGNSYEIMPICDELMLERTLSDFTNWKNEGDIPSAYHPCTLVSFDHILRSFPSGQSGERKDTPFIQSSGSHILIFSSLSSPSSAPFLRKLLGLADQSNDFAVVFRPSDSEDCRVNPSVDSDTLCRMRPQCCGNLLGGYGAELAVKSSEYKTIDDSGTTTKESVVKQQADVHDIEEEEEDEFIHLGASTSGGDPDRLLSEKELERLGLQAVSEIAGHRVPGDPFLSGQRQFEAWYRLAANFPAEVTRLSMAQVPTAVASAVRRLHNRVFERSNVLTINGGTIESSGRQPSFFGILKCIGPQIVALELLSREGIPLDDCLQFIHPTPETPINDIVPRVALNLASLPTRLDWRIENPENINQHVPLIPIWDVMTDSSTSHWPERMDKMSLLMMMRGMMNVKAPLYHILVIFDPFDISQLSAALEYLQVKAPMRLYFLPVATQCSQMESSSQLWDEELYGQRPDSLPLLMSNETSLDASCKIRETLAELFFRLLLSSDSDGQRRALKFLQEIKNLIQNFENSESVVKVTDLLDLFAAQGGIKISIEAIGQLEHARRLEEYTTRKGLVSNSVILNGRVLELRSLKDTMEVSSGAHIQQVRLFDLFQWHIMQEQQSLVHGILYDLFSIPDDPTQFILSQGSVPSCLFPEELFSESSRSGDSGRESENYFCEIIAWDGKQRDSASESPLGLPQWNKIKDRIMPGAFTLQFNAMPLLSPELLKKFPPIFISNTDGCWPIDILVSINSQPAGLRVVEELLQHLRNGIQNQTALQRAFPTYPFCRSLRLIVHPSIRQQSVELITSPVTAILKLGQHSESFLSMEESLEISTLILRASRLVLESNASDSSRSILSTLPQQVFLNYLTLRHPNANGAESWMRVQSRINPTTDLSLLDDISPDSAAVVAVNGQFMSVSHKKSQSTRLRGILDILEASVVNPDLETLAWPSFVKNQESITGESKRRNEDESREGDEETSFNFYDSIIAGERRITDPDLFIYAMEIRHRALKSLDAWKLPEKLFHDSRSVLKVHLPSPNRSLPSPLRVYGVIDPLSGQAQGLIPIMYTLNKVLNVEVNLVMNPAMLLKEYPLIIHFPEVLSITSNDFSIVHYAPVAAFAGLITKHILTTGIHVPDTWLVRACATNLDLDNLRPSGPSNRRQLLSATFELSDIFLEGQAFPGRQPRELTHLAFGTDSIAGLQLSLHSFCEENGRCDEATTESVRPWNSESDISNTTVVNRDTIVMGNLAYFQLRASPGLFWIRVDHHTQLTSSRFALSSNSPSESYSISVPIVVNSLLGVPQRLRFVRVADGHTVTPAVELGGWNILSSVKKLIKGGSRLGGDSCTETIHVFSLASGHVYERLLRIMISSVRKHTKCPLKFWFIDNFLSPRFKQIMPAMARQYNLKYSFVTYKWPSWLTRQTEKQRQIWAYKILFLDVLFPNDVTKVIYIDADQVVRSDIRELWDMDLKGNVYGFTPFCDSNLETEGFRFWKQGYWKNHLQGKPYHISALFVVDLKQFRLEGAGDSLRSIYMALSRDKNSLSNLDQDLPNFAQHELPIFSLPREWLWCETWCSTETLATAKTVDLCNNPMTKEPKLSQARRILPEWIHYDEEIRELEQKVFALSPPQHMHPQIPLTTPIPYTASNIPVANEEL